MPAMPSAWYRLAGEESDVERKGIVPKGRSQSVDRARIKISVLRSAPSEAQPSFDS